MTRRWFGALAAAALSILLLGRPVPAAEGPAGFVAGLGGRTVHVLDRRDLSPGERREAFSRDLRAAFDFPAAARFVLGGYWRSATPPERAAFVHAMSRYLVADYWGRLRPLVPARFVVIGERRLGLGRYRVFSELFTPHRQRPIGLEWALIVRGGHYRLIDLSIDRFSQVLALRSQVDDMLNHNRGDFAAVLGWMREKSARLIG